MDARHFDAVAKGLAARRSRRTVLRIGDASLAAVAVARQQVRAQGTPASTASNGMAANNATLFVQTATGGTFAANPQAGTPMASGKLARTHGTYVMTLQGHSGETIAFSDRPQRNFGEVQTTKFFKSMGFTAVNPPNAALVADTPQHQGAVYLVELMTPHYDETIHTLTYEANLLHQYPNARGNALASLATNAQTTPPTATFTNASLFLDDCPDADPLNCLDADCRVVGNLGDRGMCWHWLPPGCQPCSWGWSGTASECNAKYSACNGQCITDSGGCNGPVDAAPGNAG